MRVIQGMIVSMVLLLVPYRALADGFTLFGDARAIALGGAHVALEDQSDPTVNPAMLSSVHGFHLGNGGIQAALQGISTSDLFRNLGRLTQVTDGGDQAVNITQTFANRSDDLSVIYGLRFGLGYGPVLVSFVGQARSDGSQFVGNPGLFGASDQTTTTINGLSDYYKVSTGYAYGPEISFGHAFHNPVTRQGEPLQIGVNVRILHGAFQPFVVSTPRDAQGNLDTAAIDKNGYISYGGARESGSGVGVDLGALMGINKKLTVGLTVDNALPAQLPGFLFRTIVSTGAAYHLVPKLLLVADLDNMTNAYNDGITPRLGAEYKPWKFLALRAGVSGEGPAVGIGLWSFDLAYSGTHKAIVSEVLHF